MGQSHNKVEVFFESNFSFAADSVNVEYGLNDIPTANLSLILRTAEEVQQLQSIDSNLFTPVKIKVKINNEEVTVFEGVLAGIQTRSSAAGISASAGLYGGLYKLSQLSVATLGFHPQANTLSQVSMKSLLLDTTNLSASSDLITTIKNTLTVVINKAVTAIQSDNLLNNDIQQIPQAVKDLFKFQGETYLKVLDEELSKLKSVKIESSVYELISNERLKHIILYYGNTPNLDYWSFLINLCETYQLSIGALNDNIYVIPSSPLGEEAITIIPEDISSIQISPFPIHLPTRCYFSIQKQSSSDMSLMGMFPVLDNAAKATTLEQKLGTIRALYYSEPGWALHNKDEVGDVGDSSGAKKKLTVLDKFAQAYLLKETLKHRTASLTTKFLSNIPVGAVIAFTDPFFNKSYRGYVTGVSHSISSTAIYTSIQLQYVVSSTEREFLGLDADGYTENPLYPEYSSKDLVSLLASN